MHVIKTSGSESRGQDTRVHIQANATTTVSQVQYLYTGGWSVKIFKMLYSSAAITDPALLAA